MRSLLLSALLLLPLTACFEKADEDEDDGDGASDGGGWDLGGSDDSGWSGGESGGTEDDPDPLTDEPDTETDPDPDTDTDVDTHPWDGTYGIEAVVYAWNEAIGTVDAAYCLEGRYELSGGRLTGGAVCEWSGPFSSMETELYLVGSVWEEAYVDGTAVMLLDGFEAEGFFEGEGDAGEIVITLFFDAEETGGELYIEGEGVLYWP